MSFLRTWNARGQSASVTVALVVICVIALTWIVSSGNDRPDDKARVATASEFAAAIVTPAQVRRTQPDSPSRTLLNWFQAVQFQDYDAVADLVDPALLARVRPDVLRAATATVGASFGHPTIVTTRIASGKSALRVLVVRYGADGKVVGSQPTTFDLKRSGGGEWKLTDVTFLIRESDRLAASAPARKTG